MKSTVFTILFITILAINTSATAQEKTVIEQEADACIEHIKPTLKDPTAPYARNIRKESSVIKMDLYAKNSYGGYFPQPVACEIKSGRVDPSWTKIHLERLGFK